MTSSAGPLLTPARDPRRLIRKNTERCYQQQTAVVWRICDRCGIVYDTSVAAATPVCPPCDPIAPDGAAGQVLIVDSINSAQNHTVVSSRSKEVQPPGLHF